MGITGSSDDFLQATLGPLMCQLSPVGGAL